MKSGAAVWATAAILAAMTIATSALWRGLPQQPGSDFVQFWGMAKAQRLSHYQLGSPYLQRSGYQQYFRAMAAESQDRRLAFAVLNRQMTDPTGTPLLYYLMGNLPDRYSLVLQTYRLVQLAAFLVAVILLLRPNTAALGVFVVALTAAYAPLLYDLAVSNLNCLQLLSLVLIAAVIARKPHGTLTPCLLAAALVVLTLLKPNLSSASLLLGLCLLVRYPQQRLPVVATGLSLVALLLVMPCLLFGSWSVWLDWWHFSFSTDEVLAFPISAGNYSSVRLLESVGLTPAKALSLSAALLALPLLIHWSKLSRLIVDPWLCLATGVILMLSLSPLIWQHYHVMALIPALWLCRSPAALPRIAGVVSLLLFADLPMNLNTVVGGVPEWAIEWAHAFGWVPAWYGMVWLQRSSPLPSVQNQPV